MDYRGSDTGTVKKQGGALEKDGKDKTGIYSRAEQSRAEQSRAEQREEKRREEKSRRKQIIQNSCVPSPTQP